MNWQWASIDTINDIDTKQLEQLVPIGNKSSPFLCKAFLSALEQTHCVGNTPSQPTGWKVAHILIKDKQSNLVAFLPAYLKSHSYGEYIFDHSWAHAYQQHGLSYYPKLIIAIPFTPVTGPRVLVNKASKIDEIAISQYLSKISDELLTSLGAHSLHMLFPEKETSNRFESAGFHQRQSVQFNWYNKSYVDFEDYLQALTARRRRSIKKERNSISRQGVEILRLAGQQIDASHMRFFYRCYQQTYLKRSGHTGYLNAEFFKRIYEYMRDNLLLVIAQKNEDYIASALFFYNKDGLYGRYWGAVSETEVSGLHFEACYYQGIEFCIENNIDYFNPGTQGEHKILRGFEPTICYSNHKMLALDFDKAVADFVQREKPQIAMYAKNASTLLPFKN